MVRMWTCRIMLHACMSIAKCPIIPIRINCLLQVGHPNDAIAEKHACMGIAM